MAEFGRTLFFLAAFFMLNLTLVNGGCGWTRPFDFQCKNGDCIYFYQKCDSIKDCHPDGEDELDCPTTIPTTEGPTTEESVTEKQHRKSLFEEKILDFETSSVSSTAVYWRGDTEDMDDDDISSLHVNPSFAEADLDDDVTISCKVKGNRKFKVEWFKSSKMPLPENAKQNDNGDLTITKINFKNGGYYTCIASDESNKITYQNTTYVLVHTVQKPLAGQNENGLKVARDTRTRNRISTTSRNYPRNFQYSRLVSTRAPKQETSNPGKVIQIVPCPKNVTIPDGSCCITKVYCEPCNASTTTTTPGPTVNYLYFKCGSGETISYSKRCNKLNDCKDGSDEYQCPGTTPPPEPPTNGTCAPNEFTCDNGECIPNDGYCDNEMDCLDRSDEKYCKTIWKPKIVQLPTLKQELHCVDPSEPSYIARQALQLECKWVGEPTPKVFWKKYEGAVPSKCISSSRHGHGTLTCPNFEPSDQGAYSCVAENAAGAAESQPKSIVVCSNPIPCSGFKVLDEQNIDNCLDCYCSNRTNDCHNIKSTVNRVSITFPETETEVFVDKSGKITFIPYGENYVPPVELRSISESVTYCSVHENILKQNSFVKSYGRNINVPRYNSRVNFAVNAPDLIIRGDGLTLTYSFNKISHRSERADVRFWRGNWIDLDNNPANRIQLMRVLAHLDLLLIRCEYEQNYDSIWDTSDVIELESAVIAEYADSVSYLERCICPIGYSGLSCEICAAGYYREKGTGNCEKEYVISIPPPCEEGYKGEDCSKCDVENGYQRDPFTQKCLKKMCNTNGTAGTGDSGQCICKKNVFGEFCDQCKEGSFDLNRNDTSGCRTCWCNGVSTDCRSLNYYRSWITSTSYGGYNSSDERHFWLLPSDFNGNRLTSYGGRLEYTIRYDPEFFPRNPRLTVEILNNNNVTIVCNQPKSVKSLSSFETSWIVPIEESYWRDREGKILTRFEILQVLVYVKAIYIESPYHLSSGRANLTSLSLDTVSKNPEEDLIFAVEVEECRCPDGYEGFSCETCAEGYTRDKDDHTKCIRCNCTSNCDPEKGCEDCPEHFYGSKDEGSTELQCEPCPCSNNDRYCYLDDFEQIICICKAGFSGMHCEHNITETNKSQLKVTISPNKVKNRRIGTKIVFNCSYDSTEEMIIEFKKVYGNGYDKKDNGFELPPEDMQKTNKFGSMRSLEVEIEEGLKHVECFVFNSLGMEVGRVMAVIEGTVINLEAPVITNCYAGIHEIKEEGSLELICEAKGVPKPKITWFRDGNPLRRLDTTDGVHSIENATLDDAGMYSCQATNEAGADTCTHRVIVKKKCLTLDVKPNKLLVIEGDQFSLTCKASEDGKIVWTVPLGIVSERIHSAKDGRLTIYDAKIEDSGNYTCFFTSQNGSINKTAEVIVEKKRFRPTAIIREVDQTIEAHTNFEINCDVTGYPEPYVTWTAERSGKWLDNVYVTNNKRTLLIRNAKIENEGIYGCSAYSSEGNSSSQIYIRVRDSFIEPKIRILPHSIVTPTAGETVQAQCLIEAGTPTPIITWQRLDRKEINADINGGILSISKADWNHTARYVCIAKNVAGRAEAILEIDVLYPPVVEVSPKEVIAIKDDRVELTCKAKGNPLPRIRWSAGSRNSKRDSSASFKDVTDLLQENELSIKVVAKPEISHYICTAENSIGTISATIPFTFLGGLEEPLPVVSKEAEIGTSFLIKCEGASGLVKWSKLNDSIRDECVQSDGLFIPSVQIQHRGTYICKSENGSFPTRRILLHVVGFVNKFSQALNSFLVLPVTPDSNNLRIDITFRPELPNGILLLEKHNQQFSLYMKELQVFLALNFVENGPVIIGHKANLSLSTWYTAIITITKHSADLLIYGEDSKEVDSIIARDISHNSNLSEIKEIFLGGSNLTRRTLKIRNIPALPSFEGCVSRFIQGEQEYKITERGLYSKAVSLCKMCSSPSNPCKNAGTCFDAPSQYGFVCVCPNGKVQKETSTCPHFCQGIGCDTKHNFCQLLNPCNDNKHSPLHNCILLHSSLHCECAYGYSGTTCEIAKEYSFHVKGDGYVKLDSSYLDHGLIDQPEIIEMEFTTETNDGLLLWQGDATDHVYIALINGRIEYVYHTQGTELKVTSDYTSMKSKHHLTTTRKNNTVTLELDDGFRKADAVFHTDRVRGDVYLGSFPNITEMTRGKVTKGLSGCINYVVLGVKKSKINILEKDITLHNATKQCSAQNEVDNIPSEEVSGESLDSSERIIFESKDIF